MPLSDGDTVNVFPDSTGGGHDGLKIGNPIFKVNILGGKPVVRLRSASLDGFNLASAIGSLSPWMAFVVMKPATTGSVLVGLGGTGGPLTDLYYSDGNFYFVSNTDNANAPSGSINNAFHVLTTYSQGGGTFFMWVDGTTMLIGTSPSANAASFSTLGYRGLGPLYSDGDIAELVLCKATLSTTDRQNAEATLAAKYGTPAPPAGSVIDLSTLPGLQGWWKADSLLGPLIIGANGNAAGAGTAIGTSSIITLANGSSTGAGTATGASGIKTITSADGSAAGSSVVLLIGIAIRGSLGSASGVASALAVSGSLAQSNGASSGASSSSAISATIQISVATSQGISLVIAATVVVVAADGSAAGSSVAFARAQPPESLIASVYKITVAEDPLDIIKIVLPPTLLTLRAQK